MPQFPRIYSAPHLLVWEAEIFIDKHKIYPEGICI